MSLIESLHTIVNFEHMKPNRQLLLLSFMQYVFEELRADTPSL